MKIRTAAMATAVTVATAGAVGIASASIAAADDVADAATHPLGSQASLTNGDVVQGWTVSDLKQSTDTLNYPVHGALWEATATDEAVQGSVTPIVSNLNARTPSGQTYRVLYQVATPQGVNPATLLQGEKTTGKVYFDVTDETPNSVVYTAGGKDLATWVQPAPTSGSSSSVPAGRASSSSAPGGPATSAPAANQETPAGTPGTSAPAGSQGTPIPEGSQGTPIPAGTEEAPAGSPATPGPEGTSQAPAGSPATPGPEGTSQAPAGSPATPGPAGTPQAPAAGPEAPAPGGAPATAPAGGAETPTR